MTVYSKILRLKDHCCKFSIVFLYSIYIQLQAPKKFIAISFYERRFTILKKNEKAQCVPLGSAPLADCTYSKDFSILVSLTCFLLKSLERILDTHLRTIVVSTLSAPNTHLKKGKVVETALLSLISDKENLCKKGYTLSVFLEMEGAFKNISPDAVLSAFHKQLASIFEQHPQKPDYKDRKEACFHNKIYRPTFKSGTWMVQKLTNVRGRIWLRRRSKSPWENILASFKRRFSGIQHSATHVNPRPQRHIGKRRGRQTPMQQQPDQ